MRPVSISIMDAPLKNPLYERWLDVAANREGQMAVRELTSAREWSFADLRDLATTAPPSPPILHSTARGLQLILDVLRSWRDGSVLVADDRSGGAPPSLSLVAPGICHLKVTSGFSGPPRYLGFRPEQLAADAAQIVATMGLRPEWANLGVISMAHSYGFSNLVLPLLLHGVPLWLLDSPLPEVLRRALNTEQPLTLPAVPAMWHAWNRVHLDLSPVQLAISAGAPLPLTLEDAVFARTGLKIHNFYGSSECGGIAYDQTTSPRGHTTFIGTPMAGVTVAIDPPTGCLRITSAAVTEGYVTGDSTPHDACRPAAGTWLTQDLARVDEGGGVHLLGRSSNVINVAGHKLSPAVIEDVLHRIPGVRHCVVFGVPSPNPIRVEELVACVNLDPGIDPGVLKSAFSSLPSTYCPRHWWLCAELLPDGRGKISCNQWRERWLAAPARKTSPPAILHESIDNPD